jgi:hypothetical protein
MGLRFEEAVRRPEEIWIRRFGVRRISSAECKKHFCHLLSTVVEARTLGPRNPPREDEAPLTSCFVQEE